MAKRPAVNYLNNRDMLYQIHLSKASFSAYINKDTDREYDVIIGQGDQPLMTPEEINEKILALDLAELKQLRITRINKHLIHEYTKKYGKPAAKEYAAELDATIDNVADSDVVFRVMTYRHVPLAPGRKKTVKSVADSHIRCTFPPYEHYRIVNSVPVLVGRSHWHVPKTWTGDWEDGKFCVDAGRMTEELGRMMLKMCERIGTKGNWRNYTYLDEMKSQAVIQLSAVGLQFDESRSLNPFSYYTTTVENSFTKILNTEKQMQEMRDDILEMNGLAPSFTRQTKNETALMAQYIDSSPSDVTDIDNY